MPLYPVCWMTGQIAEDPGVGRRITSIAPAPGMLLDVVAGIGPAGEGQGLCPHASSSPRPRISASTFGWYHSRCRHQPVVWWLTGRRRVASRMSCTRPAGARRWSLEVPSDAVAGDPQVAPLRYLQRSCRQELAFGVYVALRRECKSGRRPAKKSQDQYGAAAQLLRRRDELNLPRRSGISEGAHSRGGRRSWQAGDNATSPERCRNRSARDSASPSEAWRLGAARCAPSDFSAGDVTGDRPSARSHTSSEGDPIVDMSEAA